MPTTLHPVSASRRATARPMPVELPITRTRATRRVYRLAASRSPGPARNAGPCCTDPRSEDRSGWSMVREGMSGRVQGKVAIVTGAASGIGKRCAEVLAREGARVVLTDVDEAGGRAAAEALGAPHTFERLDVTDEAG